MADDRAVQAAPGLHPLIASPLHTAGAIVFWALDGYVGWVHAAQSRAGIGSSRSIIYGRTMLSELLFLGVVVIGVRMRGASLRSVFGERWRSALDALRDLGLGVLLLIVSTLVVSMIAGHQSGASSNQSIEFLLPKTALEGMLWILLSVTAGICEEAIYRGYFQWQFGALTHNVPAGILLSAALFAGSHLYQGLGRALVIFVSSILFGAVVHWRGTVRPGMFAHTIQDAIAPTLLKLMRH